MGDTNQDMDKVSQWAVGGSEQMTMEGEEVYFGGEIDLALPRWGYRRACSLEEDRASHVA